MKAKPSVEGATPFQERVYAATRCIPFGQVTSYKELAAFVGCGSPQAIGQALKRNPYAPEVPCHRVIRRDGSIGGFAGRTSGPEISRKLRLLKAEGVRFSNGCLIDSARWFHFQSPRRRHTSS